MSPENFVKDILCNKLQLSTVIVGYNHTFGANSAGSVYDLKRICSEHGIELIVIDPVKIGNEPVSSTKIRNAIKQNDLEKAKKFLGRDFSVLGKVVTGHGIGRKMGYPTANIDVSHEFIPVSGVYLVRTGIKSDNIYYGIANVGVRPTFFQTVQFPLVEVHLLNFSGKDLYKSSMEVSFLKKIREEMEFSNLEELRDKIHEDEKWAKKTLETESYL